MNLQRIIEKKNKKLHKRPRNLGASLCSVLSISLSLFFCVSSFFYQKQPESIGASIPRAINKKWHQIKFFLKKKAKSGSILLSKKNSPFPISMTRSSFLFFLFFFSATASSRCSCGRSRRNYRWERCFFFFF